MPFFLRSEPLAVRIFTESIPAYPQEFDPFFLSLVPQCAHHARRPQPKPRACHSSPRVACTPTIIPRFDLRETETTYELSGELPGVEKENLTIEFTDAQTLVMRGSVTNKAQEPQPATHDTETTEAAATVAAEPASEPEKTNRRHQATVEDDPDDETSSISSWTSVGSAKPDTPKSAAAEPQLPHKTAPTTPEVSNISSQGDVKNSDADSTPLFRERTISKFYRKFSFDKEVDPDTASAHLTNGLLSITVNKKPSPSLRRILIL